MEMVVLIVFINFIFHSFSEDIELDSIVHIQQNVDGRFQQYPERWQTIYFVELDIRRKPKGLVNNNNNNNNKSKGTITRFSQLVHIMDGVRNLQPQQRRTQRTSRSISGASQMNENDDRKYGRADKDMMKVSLKTNTLQWQKIISTKTNSFLISCLLYTSPSPRDKRQSRMPSSA